MSLNVFLSLLCFSSFSAASSISWFTPEPLDENTQFNCPEIAEYVNSFEYQDINSFQFWTLDINNDSIQDHIVVAGVPSWCGSAGCTAHLFLGGEHHCQAISSPYLYHDQKIGLQGNRLFLSNGKHGKCPLWEYADADLTHIETRESCE